MKAPKKQTMTLMEAEAGIGQRVTDTESGKVGVLQGVKQKRHWYAGVVRFPHEVCEVYLKRLTWTDGLKTPFTLRVPYSELLNLFHFASSNEQRGPADLRRKLFKRLFGREPTANEKQYMAGKRDGGVCNVCGYRQSLGLNPGGSVDLECWCEPSCDTPSSVTPTAHPLSGG